MDNQCQHMTELQRNALLKILQNIEYFFYGTLDTWKTDPVDLKLKEDAKPIFSRSFAVTKVYKEMSKRKSNV